MAIKSYGTADSHVTVAVEPPASYGPKTHRVKIVAGHSSSTIGTNEAMELSTGIMEAVVEANKLQQAMDAAAASSDKPEGPF